ncbi:hypothetical protein BJX99DRAFT_191513 [Aspergillus californicus]
MPPPSNNIANLRQYIQQLQPRFPVMQPPPPYPYTINSQDSDLDHDGYDDYDDYDEYDDYDYDNEDRQTTTQTQNQNQNQNQPTNPSLTSSTKTITINLNSSIQIKGDANTIVITSQPQSQSQVLRQTTKDTTVSPNEHPVTNSKIATTTAAILAALQISGVLNTQSESGTTSTLVSTSVQINIDAGVKVDGVRNAICFGSATARAGACAAKAQSTPSRRFDEHDGKDACGRKRRAVSEPINLVETKKSRTL